MNKLLYISNFLNNSGYSEAASTSVKALKALGYPVVCRNINLTNTIHQDNQIQSLCLPSAHDCNILLIHSLPELAQYDGSFKKCIIRFNWEIDNLNTMSWIKHLKLMDEIWVSSNFEKRVLKKHNLKNIQVLPYCVNINRFNHSYNNESIASKIKNATNNYIFYTIGEYVGRKNYEGLLRSWHSNFSIFDNASLIIKTNNKEIEELNHHVKLNTKVNKRWMKDPVFITNRLLDDDLDALHNHSDCFVSMSHGEGWCQPALDAMCFGKPVIVPNYSAFTDYVTNENGYLINGILQNCYGTLDTSNHIYNSYQQWFEPSIYDLGILMKNLVKDPQQGVHKGAKGKLLAEFYSYESVGNEMIKVLET